MHSCFNGTFFADDLACLFTAVQTGRRTFYAFATFLAPASNLEIALRTIGTMGSFVGCAFTADD